MAHTQQPHKREGERGGQASVVAQALAAIRFAMDRFTVPETENCDQDDDTKQGLGDNDDSDAGVVIDNRVDF